MNFLDELIVPWVEAMSEQAGGLELFDAHTHVGRNDPDGFKQTVEQLVEALEVVDCRALVFPMHEPDGYTAANDRVIEAAAASGGRLACLCRVDPNAGAAAVTEARRALDAGARGIKLHPRAEQFTMSHPTVRELVALADERRAPVLIHAGRGIPALGSDTVRLSGEFRGAKLILAHAAVSDIAWLWRELPDHPNVFIDTSWWNPADLISVCALAPPGQVLWASDSPYGRPAVSAIMGLRCAVHAGLTPEQLRGFAGGQLARLLAGEEPLDLGPAPGQPAAPLDLLLERVVSHLTSAMGRAFVGGDPSESIALARLACAVGEDSEIAPVCSAVLELLDLYDRHLEPPPPGQMFPWAARLVVLALIVARTPDVPVGPLPDAPRPRRDITGE